MRAGPSEQEGAIRTIDWVLASMRQRPARLVLLPTGAGTPKVLDRGALEPNGGAILRDGSVGFGVRAGQGGIEFYRIDPRTGVVRPFKVAGSDENAAFVVDRSAVYGPDGALARTLPMAASSSSSRPAHVRSFPAGRSNLVKISLPGWTMTACTSDVRRRFRPRSIASMLEPAPGGSGGR